MLINQALFHLQQMEGLFHAQSAEHQNAFATTFQILPPTSTDHGSLLHTVTAILMSLGLHIGDDHNDHESDQLNKYLDQIDAGWLDKGDLEVARSQEPHHHNLAASSRVSPREPQWIPKTHVINETLPSRNVIKNNQEPKGRVPFLLGKDALEMCVSDATTFLENQKHVVTLQPQEVHRQACQLLQRFSVASLEHLDRARDLVQELERKQNNMRHLERELQIYRDHIASSEQFNHPLTEMDQTKHQEIEILRMQLDAAQRQVRVVRKECDQIQKLCDEVCQDTEKQRQLRRALESELHQVKEQMRQLYDESIDRARTLRADFEQELHTEREQSARLTHDLNICREQLKMMDQERAEASSNTRSDQWVPSTRIEKQVQTSPVWKRHDEFRKPDDDGVSDSHYCWDSNVMMRKDALEKMIKGDRSRVPLSNDDNVCDHPEHQLLYVRLHHAMKQRDMWMQESQSLARSLSFLKKSFHY